jgi:hypothetical protein
MAVCLPSCTVFGPELYGFRPGFPYKVGQLPSSNKNSEKCKVSPSLKKTQHLNNKHAPGVLDCSTSLNIVTPFLNL